MELLAQQTGDDPVEIRKRLFTKFPESEREFCVEQPISQAEVLNVATENPQITTLQLLMEDHDDDYVQQKNCLDFSKIPLPNLTQLDLASVPINIRFSRVFTPNLECLSIENGYAFLYSTGVFMCRHDSF